MKDVLDLNDLTVHGVHRIGDEQTTGRKNFNTMPFFVILAVRVALEKFQTDLQNGNGPPQLDPSAVRTHTPALPLRGQQMPAPGPWQMMWHLRGTFTQPSGILVD